MPRYSMAESLRKRRKVGFIDRHGLVMSEEIADMQTADETLVAVRKAIEKTTSVRSGFFILLAMDASGLSIIGQYSLKQS